MDGRARGHDGWAELAMWLKGVSGDSSYKGG